jgi:hypothetical protein
MSLINKETKRTEPCGIPWVTGEKDENVSLQDTHWVISIRQDLTNRIAESEKLKRECNFWHNRSWLTVSQSFEKSRWTNIVMKFMFQFHWNVISNLKERSGRALAWPETRLKCRNKSHLITKGHNLVPHDQLKCLRQNRHKILIGQTSLNFTRILDFSHWDNLGCLSCPRKSFIWYRSIKNMSYRWGCPRRGNINRLISHDIRGIIAVQFVWWEDHRASVQHRKKSALVSCTWKKSRDSQQYKLV